MALSLYYEEMLEAHVIVAAAVVVADVHVVVAAESFAESFQLMVDYNAEFAVAALIEVA